ncbi:hypothetical protein AGMMS49938_08750 [Fibrobacterales bacterium]|nr:hypothetical protein AGMMS49938_08750 [Fibrobacterales bacterium]
MIELQYLETHVADRCNLNCKGCSHFSPIAQKNSYSIDEFKKDIERLAEFIDEIKIFRLLGGEPFMTSNLKEYIVLSRKFYPTSDLRIVTNGLLIHKADCNLIETIKKNNVQLDISLYHPTLTIIDKILKTLKKNNLRYNLLGPIKKFRKQVYFSANSNIISTFKNCKFKNCTFLYKGNISACPAPSLYYLLNTKFGTNFNGESDVLSIHSPNVTTKQILEFINRPLDVCKYCGEYLEIDWEQSTVANISDWLIDAHLFPLTDDKNG